MNFGYPTPYTGRAPGAKRPGVFDLEIQRNRTPGYDAYYESTKRARLEGTVSSSPDAVMDGIESWPQQGLGYSDFKRNINTRLSIHVRDIGSPIARRANLTDQLVFMQFAEYMKGDDPLVAFDNPGLGFVRPTRGSSEFAPPMGGFEDIVSASVLNLPMFNGLLASELAGTDKGQEDPLTPEAILQDLHVSFGGVVNNTSHLDRADTGYVGEGEFLPKRNVTREGEAPVVSVWDVSGSRRPDNDLQLYLVMKRVPQEKRSQYGLQSSFRYTMEDAVSHQIRPSGDRWEAAPYQVFSYASTEGPPPPSVTEFQHTNGEWDEGKVWRIGSVLYQLVQSAVSDGRSTLCDASATPASGKYHVNFKPEELTFIG